MAAIQNKPIVFISILLIQPPGCHIYNKSVCVLCVAVEQRITLTVYWIIIIIEREAFSRSLPPLRSFVKTFCRPPATGPQSLWYPCRGRSGGSRSCRVDHRHVCLHFCDGHSPTESPSLVSVQSLKIWTAGTVCGSLATWLKRSNLRLHTITVNVQWSECCMLLIWWPIHSGIKAAQP